MSGLVVSGLWVSRLWVSGLWATLLLGAGALVPQSPAVERMAPMGGQRGTEVSVTLTGQRFFEPRDLMLSRPGLEVLEVKAEKAEQCAVRLRIAKDCPLGAHPVRLRTDAGISNLLLFSVGVLPEVGEQRKAGEIQLVPLDCTINGSLRNEEIDRYGVELAAGALVHCEAQGIRLGRSNLDLVLTVSGPDGSEVARADDTVLGIKDPMLSFRSAAAGTYVVSLHTAYPEEQNAGSYRLHVGTFPRPVGCLPCGGQPGELLEVTLLGDSLGASPDAATVQVRLPDDGEEPFQFFPEVAHGTAPTPILLRVGGPPNGTPQVDKQGRAWVEFPASVHGVVGKPGQRVRFFFKAKKGVEWEFRAIARALRSPLDPALTVMRGDGRQIADNDDTAGLDSVLRFNPPEDSEYVIEVRDQLRRGGPDHFFRLEGGARADAASLRMVVNRREDSVLPVARGNRVGAVLQWTGLDPKQELVLLARDLPAGVVATFGPIMNGTNLVPLVLTASPDAALGGSQAAIWLRAVTPPHERDPGYSQNVPLVYTRNDQPLLGKTLRRLPVAVTQEAPFTISVAAPAVPIVRGAPLTLKVHVARAEGFTETVRVRALWNTPGIGSGQVAIDGKQDRGEFPLNANGGATTGRFPIALVGQARFRGGSVEVCSDWFDLQVDEPWLTAEPGRVRTEQGVAAELRVKLKPARTLAAACKAVLLGLPRGVGCEPVQFGPTDTEIVFALAVAADAAPGRHRNFLVQVLAPSEQPPAQEGGERATVEHRFGGGEIRIDPAVGKPAPSVAGSGAGKERP
ncbi:MAG TPA: PPC domain-containing protein [Planctomycetota bacterium]